MSLIILFCLYSLINQHLVVRLLLGSLTAVDLLACRFVLYNDNAPSSILSIVNLDEHLPRAFLEKNVALGEVRGYGEDVSKFSCCFI